MRPLKIINIKIPGQPSDIIIEKYKRQADDKRIDASIELFLLDAIRKGNGDVIVKLVDSWEHIIITVIENELKEQIDTSVSIEKLFDAGRTALITLAEKELGSTSRERFFRFGAWHLRQAIIKELDRENIN